MENLSVFRLNSWGEIRQRLAAPDGDKFKAYLNKVYLSLMRMQPFEVIMIRKDVAPENYDWFIKSCCLFIWDGNTDFIFSNDYAVLKRMPSKPEDDIAAYKNLLSQKIQRHELEPAARNDRKQD